MNGKCKNVLLEKSVVLDSWVALIFPMLILSTIIALSTTTTVPHWPASSPLLHETYQLGRGKVNIYLFYGTWKHLTTDFRCAAHVISHCSITQLEEIAIYLLLHTWAHWHPWVTSFIAAWQERVCHFSHIDRSLLLWILAMNCCVIIRIWTTNLLAVGWTCFCCTTWEPDMDAF